MTHRESDPNQADRLRADGITVIDLGFLGVDKVIASYLIEAGSELALVETGPSTTVENLELGVKAAGYGLADVNRIVVTHIHLDHSGAVGIIVRDHPHIRVSVHPVGAPHLVDPSRLVRSAGRIYGQDMERLWGEIVGVPEGQVDLLEDGGSLVIGDRRMSVAFTSGHASHHVVLFDEQSGTLFTGDTGGVRIPGSSYVAAPIPPPEFDPEAWAVSIGRMRAFAPKQLALTHFGVYEDAEWHLGEVLPRIEELLEMGEAAGAEISNLDRMTERFAAFQREHLGSEATDHLVQQLNLANPDILAAMGLERYLRKRAEAASS